MPRKKKTLEDLEATPPESKPRKASDPKPLAEIDEPANVLATERPAVLIKTVRPFTGRIASGRGRVVSADDSSYAIEAERPLNAGELALAQRNGFDDESPELPGTLLIGSKRAVREANGDINFVSRVMTGDTSGRGR